MTAYEKKMNKIIIKAKHDMLAVKETIEMENDQSVTEEFRDGAYNVMYLVENFIKDKLEAYINAAVKQYEDSQAKA